MSRIVHGHSDEVKLVRINKLGSQKGETYTEKSFRGFSVDGTFTQSEVDQMLMAAKQEGRRDGIKETEAKMAAPLRMALENVESVLDELSRFRRDLFKESEVEIIELIRSLTKKIVAKELAIDPTLIKGVVEKGLEVLEKQKHLYLQFSAKDFEIFSRAKEDFMSRFKGLTDLELSVDPSLEAGSAIVKSKTSEVDVNLEHMVDHLLNQITKAKESATEVNDEGDQV